MAVLTILKFPDPRLHKVARPVVQVDDRVRAVVKDMAQTMYAAPGVGLAATQVDIHEQIIVIDVTEEKNDLLVFINPEVVSASEDLKVFDEGCLSVPGIYEEVERPDRVKVKALNQQGEWFTKDCDGLLAVCIQHEMDHLKGKVFVQYLSRLKQSRIRSKMLKLERDGPAADERAA
jgi:peptide deformylase